MKFTMAVKMPQAAFRFGKGNEMAKTLRELAALLDDTELFKGPVLNSRGIAVGSWEITR